LVKACHYGPGGRGFAGSSRAAGYTTLGMTKHRDAAKGVCVVAQIEDAVALDAIDAIAHVDGIDTLFIGRADLTVSLGASSPDDPIVVEAVEAICAAGQRAGRAVGMFLARASDVPLWNEKGASLFILGSDHEFLLQGSARLNQAVRSGNIV
jgi:2-keto-3-deoxy-L-rhamnonate aldolase RhmA